MERERETDRQTEQANSGEDNNVYIQVYNLVRFVGMVEVTPRSTITQLYTEHSKLTRQLCLRHFHCRIQ